MAELRPYEPTWRDRIAQMMMGNAKASPERRRFVEGLLGSSGLGNTGMGVVDVTPVGGLLQAQEAVSEGDPRGAALAVLPIPGAAKAKSAAKTAADAATPQGIRAYHGSPNEFERFDINKAGSNRDPGALGRALYFSTDNVVAEGSIDRGKRYGGYPHKYEVDITPRNPLMLEHPGPGASWSAKMDALSKQLGLEPPKTKEEWATWADTASKVARERGHDAIVYDYAPMNYKHKEIAVLDDSIIDILRKYGLVPGMIGGGAAGFGLLGPVDASAAER